MAKRKKFTKAEIIAANAPFYKKVVNAGRIPLNYDNLQIVVSPTDYDTPTTIQECAAIFYFGESFKSVNAHDKKLGNVDLRRANVVAGGVNYYDTSQISLGSIQTFIKYKMTGVINYGIPQCKPNRFRSFDDFVVFVNSYIDMHYLDIYKFLRNANFVVRVYSIINEQVDIRISRYKLSHSACNTVRRIVSSVGAFKVVNLTENTAKKGEAYNKAGVLNTYHEFDMAKLNKSKISSEKYDSVISWIDLEQELVALGGVNKAIEIDLIEKLTPLNR